MKQTYVKPSIIVERFTLTQSIASGCGAEANTIGDPNIWDKNSCGWVIGSLAVFIEGNTKCTYLVGADEEISGVCYNNPGGGNTIFGS